ncbi:MAG TPA: DUF2817 domain-containing protein [bacterium]|nr:MAG: Zinc carboxypeptidase [Parcubacteria group bacterium ADurb.Bin192]HPN14765.1 DUF2817 domain-containing protein [bacterium]
MSFESYCEELHRICALKKFDLQEAGLDAYAQYPLYRITVNPSAKHTICLTAGIHGNETSGPLGILKFLQNYQAPRTQAKLIIFPLLNPYGFTKNKREDRGNLNLNRHYFEKPQPKAVKTICDLIKQARPDFSLSLHEDDELSCFYIYQYGTNNELSSSIMDFIGRRAKVCRDAKIYDHKAVNGIIKNPAFDGTLDEWLHARNMSDAACLEIPDSIPLKKRVDLIAQILEFIAQKKTA